MLWLRSSPTTKRVIDPPGKSQRNHIINARFHTAWIKTRHTEVVAKLCADHIGLVAAKDIIDKHKETIRGTLDKHTTDVVKPYERRINEHLAAFPPWDEGRTVGKWSPERYRSFVRVKRPGVE